MSSIPTTAWDENSPAGSQAVSLGDDRIREMKTQVREVVSVDHKMGSSGNDPDNGKHNKITLLEQSDLGTGTNGKPILGAQTANSKAELIFTNEDDVDIQITKDTKINSLALAVDLTSLAAIMAVIYPIGIVITLGVITNPSVLLGIGTWTAIAGQVIVGIDGTAEFLSLDQTGGEKTHKLTSAESGVPAHNHPETAANGGSGSSVVQSNPSSATIVATINVTGNNTAADAASSHNNLQPYIVKYVWQRTA